MSLYRFVESTLKENPEMLLLSEPKHNLNYSNLYEFYRGKERKKPIQAYLDILMYDSLCRCSSNVIEYELLKQKTRKIASLLQAKFDLTLAGNLN